MTTTRYYLDRRHKEPNMPQPLKLSITKAIDNGITNNYPFRKFDMRHH